MVHQRNPPSPLSEGEVRYEPFPCVRGLESGKGRFTENTSPDGYPIGEDFINEGRGFSPTYLKFFLLVFSQIKRSQREDQA